MSCLAGAPIPRTNAIVIPDPPQIMAGYCIVWDDGDLGATVVTLARAWRYVDKWEAVIGVVEVIPDDHGGARLVPVDRDGNRIADKHEAAIAQKSLAEG